MCILKDGQAILQEYKLLQSHYNPSTQFHELNDSSEKITLQQKKSIQNECFICFCPQKCLNLTWNPLEKGLIELFSTVSKNWDVIESLRHQIQTLQENFTQISSKVNKIQSQPDLKHQEKTLAPSKPIKKKSSEIYEKLFSNLSEIKLDKKKYKLKMVGRPKGRLFKDRHFSLKMKLVSRQNEKEIIKNKNFLNLCIGIFDKEGKWITENRNGESILKGKTKIQLFNGEANFEKINVRELSSIFKDNRINLAIYVLPSTVEYENEEESSQHIDWESISPLIISNIKVLARKKSTSDNWVMY